MVWKWLGGGGGGGLGGGDNVLCLSCELSIQQIT
jgi:hypothetical protein